MPNLNKKSSYVSPCYDLGGTYKIKILFENCDGAYDPDIINITVTSPAGEVSNPAEVKVETGFYYFDLVVNEVGKWTHSWQTTTDNVVSTTTKTIQVEDTNKSTAVQIGLDFNSLIVVELDQSIKMDGSSATLGTDQVFSFSTEYNPFYCSVEMVRMEMGAWADLVPDDTLALAIHWSSIEAENITSMKIVSEQYFYARTRFVMYDAAIKMFSMPIGADGGTGKQKQLGDLLVEEGGGIDYAIKDLIVELKEERDEWWRVVNAGGNIVLGQGLGPTSATKGGANRLSKSREWHDPWQEHYIQPTKNSLYRRSGEKEYKHGFTGWNHFYHTSVKKGRRR